MKDLFKSILTVFIFGSAFFLGYYFGEEQIKGRIPNFQDEEELD